MTITIDYNGYEIEIHKVNSRFGNLFGLVSIDGEPSTQVIYRPTMAQLFIEADAAITMWEN